MQALHARFEAIQRERKAIEQAQYAEDPNDHAKCGKLERANNACDAGENAVRYAILTQAPREWKDGLILAYHVRTEQDFQASIAESFSPIDPRPRILSNAIDALLDFMCCHTDLDHAEVGPEFKQAAVDVFYARRYRTGVVEG
jgi:hypothetical protein